MKKRIINNVLKRSIIFSILFIAIAVFLSQSIYILADFFDEFFNWGRLATILIASVIITIGYFPIRHFLIDITDNMFFLREVDLKKALIVLSDELSTYYDKQELKKYVEHKIKKVLKVNSVEVQFNSEGQDSSLIIKISKGDNVYGYICVGKKLSGEDFLDKEISFVEAVASHLVGVIDNVNLYEQVKNKAEKLLLLNEIQKKVYYNNESDTIYNMLSQEILNVFSLDDVVIFLPENDVFVVVSCTKNNLYGKLIPDSLFSFDNQINIIAKDHELLSFLEIEKKSIVASLLSYGEIKGYILFSGIENEYEKGLLKTYINYLSGVISNIQLYKKTQEMFDYNKSILESVDQVVITIKRDGTVVSANSAAIDSIGVTEGDNFYDVEIIRETFKNRIINSFRSGQEENMTELNLDTPSGVREYLMSLLFIGKHSSSVSSNLMIVLSDITELKQLKLELMQKERLAAMSSMASVIVHEIRNPLTSVSALVNLVPRQHKDQEFLEMFNDLVPAELDRVNSLMEDLLEFSRNKPLKKKEVNLKELLEERIRLLEVKASQENVNFILDAESIFAYVDEYKLSQVLQNLMQNAVQSMPSGGNVNVCVKKEYIDDDDYEKRMACISVSDTGMGMSDLTRDSLFKPFFTTKDNGTGLGLAVSKKIIEEHGGIISVKSKEGIGTTFSVYVPA